MTTTANKLVLFAILAFAIGASNGEPSREERCLADFSEGAECQHVAGQQMYAFNPDAGGCRGIHFHQCEPGEAESTKLFTDKDECERTCLSGLKVITTELIGPGGRRNSNRRVKRASRELFGPGSRPWSHTRFKTSIYEGWDESWEGRRKRSVATGAK